MTTSTLTRRKCMGFASVFKGHGRPVSQRFYLTHPSPLWRPRHGYGKAVPIWLTLDIYNYVLLTLSVHQEIWYFLSTIFVCHSPFIYSCFCLTWLFKTKGYNWWQHWHKGNAYSLLLSSRDTVGMHLSDSTSHIRALCGDHVMAMGRLSPSDLHKVYSHDINVVLIVCRSLKFACFVFDFHILAFLFVTVRSFFRLFFWPGFLPRVRGGTMSDCPSVDVIMRGSVTLKRLNLM